FKFQFATNSSSGSAGCQRGGLCFLDIPTFGNEYDPRTNVFEVAEDMRGNEYRNPFGVQPLQLLTKLDACKRIKTGGGLVKEKQLGFMKQDFRKEQALL